MSDVRAEWAIIGPGNIGKEVIRQLGQEHVANRLGLNVLPNFVVRSTGVMQPYDVEANESASFSDIDTLPDVTFIALPSTDDGEVASDYITSILDSGKIAITAEKGAMANNFDLLRDASDDFGRLGVNATVGGGTRMLDIAKQYSPDTENITQMHMALNGTLSAIMSLVGPPEGSGMSLGQAVDQAVQLGYAEPGSESSYDVIRNEAEGDIPKKSAILFNKLGLADVTIDWHDLGFELNNEDIAQAVDEAKIRRFIVSFYSKKHLDKVVKDPSDDVVGGFSKDIDGWQLVGGFQHVDRNPLFYNLAKITGPGNGIVVGLGPDETDGVYCVTGPGAGVSPTVNTMLDDYVTKKTSIK